MRAGDRVEASGRGRGAATGNGEAFRLVEAGGRLELRPPGEGGRTGIRAVFPPDSRSAPGRSPLARAFGKRILRILDPTAGLGADAYRLAESGYRVRAVERHPAVSALLESGWASDRAMGRIPHEIAERLEFLHGEGLDEIARIDSPDVGVYLDPMYPRPRRNKALPKRELQVLRQLLGEETDATELLDAARVRAARVVVKRPRRAPPLRPDVDFALSTKLVRLDVYMNPRNMGSGGRGGSS
ncbi:MAG TPA: 16S rRNA (guanine(1516)-N(2))-methyltransferase [Deltaproteobacteria bacterium]|nr:16S rRNA (guanine(1516)-N(2))-methyltransferase [Deltaproteobacteria bacterium]